MSALNETQALAIVFANIKRKSRPNDLVTVAKAFEYLYSLYGSQKAVAEKVGLSSEMVREFRQVLNLPEEVLDIVRSRQIDRVDEAYRISKIKDAGKQLKAARRAAGMLTDDIRDAERIVSRSGKSFHDAEVAVRQSKLRGLYVFVVEVEDAEHKAIRRIARQKNVGPADLVRDVIVNWLRRHRGVKKPKSNK